MTLGVNINPFTWLTLAGRFGYDTYKQDGYTFYHPESFYLTKGLGGQLDNYYRQYHGYNHTINITATKKFSNFSTRLMAGTMWQDYKTQQYSVTGTNIVDSINSFGQMVKNGVIIPNNTQLGTDSSVTRATSRTRLNNARNGLPNYVISRQLAFFAEAQVGYKNLAFLTYSHRFETSSIFPTQSRSYNYPAASLSVIVSDIFPSISKGFLSYLKLRGSLASTARSSLPYQNQSVFGQITVSGGGYAYGFTNSNPNLEPEIQKTKEIGVETKMFQNRVALEVTYYNTLCEKQIAENFRASYATGFVLNTLNVGSTRNQGVEISLNVAPIQKPDFTWNVRFNFNKMYNKVLSLPANVPEFYISDTWAYQNARGGLVKGGPSTAITSFGYLRNTNGDKLIDPVSGLPVLDQTFKVHGDRNPDFTLGTLNSFRYKNLNLSFLWDLKVGGDIINQTDMYLTTVGKSLRTNDRKTSRIIDGILKDGLENTATPTRNNIVITPYYLQSFYSTARLPDEEFIEHNVNWLALRDITLSYMFPTNMIKKSRLLKTLSVFVTGNDLILITNYTGADPMTNTNTAGTRGVGGWGFDYGNIGTPVSVNLGLRAAF